MYIIVRNDLTKPQQAVQCTHAMYEMVRKFITNGEPHPNVVILVVKNEKKLLAVSESIPIPHVHFYEPDHGNSLTAIAFKPVTGEDRDHFKRYMLMQP